MENKKIYKSKKNSMICGVCSGIAEYLNVDPTLIRILWIFFAFTGAGILTYFLIAIIMPSEPTIL